MKPPQTIIRKNEFKRESIFKFVSNKIHILLKQLQSKKQREKGVDE